MFSRNNNFPIFTNFETLIQGAGHEFIFFPKFHCELNPIEMASFLLIIKFVTVLIFFFSTTGAGVNTGDEQEGALHLKTTFFGHFYTQTPFTSAPQAPQHSDKLIHHDLNPLSPFMNRHNIP